MNPILRWLKFNLVGALGIAVQLAALAVFHRAMPGHDSLAVAAAVELTLLHNFVWHLRFTWRDRIGQSWLRQCLRFHLSNGLVSLAGNIVLMRLLVHRTHMPLLVANAMAIACCSLLNFWLGNCWAFGEKKAPSHSRLRTSLPASVSLALVLMGVSCAAAGAQTLPDHPLPAGTQRDYGTDCAYENVFFGPSASVGGTADRAPFTAGVTIGQYFAKTLGHGMTGSPQFELGVVGPLPGGYPLDGLVSVDYMFANKLPRRNVYPFLTAGYTRMFVTGNAVNFGFGIDLGKEGSARLMRI